MTKTALTFLMCAVFALGACFGYAQHKDRFRPYVGPNEIFVFACGTEALRGAEVSTTSAIFADKETREKIRHDFTCVNGLATRKSDLPKFGLSQ